MYINKKVTFCVTQIPAFGSNILYSQLYPKAKLLTEQGWECQFIGADIDERCLMENSEDLRNRYGFKDVRVYPCYPKIENYFTLDKMLKGLKVKIEEDIKKWTPHWVYFRSIFEFQKINKFAKRNGIRCVYDVRGILSNQVRHGNPGILGRIKESFLLHQERIVFREADDILCVTKKLGSWIEMVSGRSDAFVIPCCADQMQFKPDIKSRIELREMLNWSLEDPVVVYSGGATYWQRPEDLVCLLGDLKKSIPKLKVLVLTLEIDKFTQLFQNSVSWFNDLHIRAVPHNQVSSWLNIADVGLILRHDILLNNVASPIKIGEYLSTGLAIIGTKGIGEYSQVIADFDAGLILDEPLSSKVIVNLLESPTRLVYMRRNALKLSKFFSSEFEMQRLKEFLDRFTEMKIG